MSLMLSCTTLLGVQDIPPVVEINITAALVPVGDLGFGYRRPATGVIAPDLPVNGERVENLHSFATVQNFSLPQGLLVGHWDTISIVGVFSGGGPPRTVVTNRVDVLVFDPNLQLSGQPYLVSSWTLPLGSTDDQFVDTNAYEVTITWS